MENRISGAIVSDFCSKLQDTLETDAVIAGGGPSGLVAARLLAEKGFGVSVFERKLAPGGGMWGGAMMFNSIVIEEDVAETAGALGIELRRNDYGSCTADAVQATSALINGACAAGARVFNCMAVEDVVVNDENRVCGAVVNWSPVMKLEMMVDPLTVLCRAVLDATGHPADIVAGFAARNGVTVEVPGERSLNALRGEEDTVRNTTEVHSGLFVSGMSACACGGGYRMGPVFGGMIRSGVRAAELMEKSIRG